jgi:hypothetical protein
MTRTGGGVAVAVGCCWLETGAELAESVGLDAGPGTAGPVPPSAGAVGLVGEGVAGNVTAAAAPAVGVRVGKGVRVRVGSLVRIVISPEPIPVSEQASVVNPSNVTTVSFASRPLRGEGTSQFKAFFIFLVLQLRCSLIIYISNFLALRKML